MNTNEITVQKEGFFKKWGLVIGAIVLLIFVLMPTIEGLTVAGQRMIGIFLFAVIVWMSSTVSYPVSAIIIMTLIAVLLGTAPDIADTTKLMGTSKALKMGISGFSSTAFLLVAAAMFISVAMMKTGLDRRIALTMLSKVGAKVSHIYLGCIACGFVLGFFVPSSTARVACVLPIIMGILNIMDIDHRSKFAGLLVIGVAQADTMWNIMIQTAAAQNMVAVEFINSELNATVPWINWLLAAAPFSLILAVIYYFLSMAIHKPSFDILPGGVTAIAKMKSDLGPMTKDEKKLSVVLILLLFFWSTGGILHNFDTSTTTIIAIALLMLPKIGIMDWKYTAPRINWGTIVMFGPGISLGTALLKTEGATWLAKMLNSGLGLSSATPLAIIAIMGAFLILIHLGFASATALSSAMIPIVISVLQTVTGEINVVGMTMILQFSCCFGFIFPVNSPQGMVAYGTDTFEAKDFIKSGVPITIIGYLLLLVFAATYWKWIGLV
ncbi:DASS family sodium-coupled anion symporter [Limibacterium fermenti]|uniref:DASS family sodium-coupled anion symporter n=1 Tax=Limibacterium fermenti TaxID=3229863 RepID=UPI000E86F260|nr:hypothetical protein [Porphyromonadaceae bacterium]